MGKTAFITGITGQDGSFLAEHLLSAGYRVVGFARRESWQRPNCASHLKAKVEIVFGSLEDGLELPMAIQELKPDEIYNLASQSRPAESWNRAIETLSINGLGAVKLFEAVRRYSPLSRVYQASSSEMFGFVATKTQDEQSAFSAANPYAAAKIYAHEMARIYRETYSLKISCGILFNHESERRPRHFLTQKIAHGAACAALGLTESPLQNEIGKPIVEKGKLALGNLAVQRDWGYAADFVRAMHLMLESDIPDDYVIGTGTLHSLEDLCDVAYAAGGVDWRDRVYVDPLLSRPAESKPACANPAKALRCLGWQAQTSFEEMIQRMVAAEVVRLSGSNVRTFD